MTRIAPDPRRFMVLLDGPIVLVALPSIGADLGFSEQGLQWVLSAYALSFGGLLLLGRRRLFMAGVLFFTAAGHPRRPHRR